MKYCTRTLFYFALVNLAAVAARGQSQETAVAAVWEDWPHVKPLLLEAWSFFKPFLQLLIGLVIIRSAISRFGFTAADFKRTASADLVSPLLLISVLAYAVAVLADANTAHSMQDVVLVLVGVYCGRRMRTVQNDPNPSEE